MSKGVTSALELVGAAVALYFGNYQLAAALVAAAYSTERAARAEIAARNAYNASLRDRYAMVRSSTAARQLVFGRCRVSGPIFFGASYGSDNEHLTLCVALAAHEVDAIETVYFDDKPVVLDAYGSVIAVQEHDSFSITTATKTVTIQKTPKAGTVTASARYGDVIVPLTVSVSGVNVSVSGATAGTVGQLDVYYNPDPDPYAPAGFTQRSAVYIVLTSTQTFTLPASSTILPPDPSSLRAAYQVTGASSDNSQPITGLTIVGYAVTVTGLSVGRTIVFYYQTANATAKARVRKYLGAPGQAADASMMANYPGVWTPNHKATGIAYLVIELDYDADAFIGGLPSVSAVVRGMKCYDPRTGATAWTENPALHARALAMHPLAGNLPTTCVNDAAITAAANISDASATYTVGTATYVRPLYTSGYAFTVDRKPMDGLTDLCQSMGGSWVWSDGAVLVNAGTYRTPNPGTLDETWLTDDEAVQIQVGYQRTALVNTITSTFADKFQDYTPVPMPRLSPPAYRSVDGATLSQSIQYSAVTFSGQAQYISSCLLRRLRQGMVVKLRCNYRAWQDQAGDVRNVSLARFGWSNKPFEVIKDTKTADGSIELVLQETDPSIWDMDAAFDAQDIAPNTSMPVPWGLPGITSLSGTSGDSTLLRQADGTAVPQIQMTWDALTDSRVLAGGYVEIRYWRLGDLVDTYQTFKALGGDSQAFLTGVRAGSDYLIVARSVSVVTQGPWCSQVLVRAIGKSVAPTNVAGAAFTLGNGRVHLSWTPASDVDYKLTELRVGASWAAGTVISARAADSYDWPQTTLGTYTVWFAHQNWSGVYSATPASLSVVVDSSVGTLNYSVTLSSTNWVFSADSSGHIATGGYAGASTQMMVLLNGVDDSSNWTFTKADSTGLTTTISGNTVTVTAMTDTTDTAYTDITATRSGYTSQVKRFALTKSKGALATTGVNSQLGSISASGLAASPAHAIAGVQFNADGQIYTKGSLAGAAYAAHGQKWWLGAPSSVPTGAASLTLTTYLINAGTNSAGTNVPAFTLPTGTLNATQTITADVTAATVTGCAVNYTITDAANNTLAQGTVYLAVNSN